MESTSNSEKKRERPLDSHEAEDVGASEPPLKKPKAEEAPPAGGIKRAAPLPSFRSPLRDQPDLPAKSLEKAKAILAYVEANNAKLFLDALKSAFESMRTKDAMKSDLEYPQTYLSLIYVSKVAAKFLLEPIQGEDQAEGAPWRYLCEFLASKSEDAKRASELSILAANMLYQAFKEHQQWPIELVQAFLEDSFVGRLWVDDETTRPFVCSILSIAPKDRASEAFLSEEDNVNKSSSSSQPQSTPSGTNGNQVFGSPHLTNNSSRPESSIDRYPDPSIRERVEVYVGQIVEFHLATLNSKGALYPQHVSPASDELKNLIRTMALLCSYPTVRNLAARYLDTWFGHPQTQKLAKELFKRMSINTADATQSDLEVVRLVLRYKQAPSSIPQYYHEVIHRICSQQPRLYRIAAYRDLISDHLVSEYANIASSASSSSSSTSGGSGSLAGGSGSTGNTTNLKAIGKLFDAVSGINQPGQLHSPEAMADLASAIHELALNTDFAPNLKLLVPMLLLSSPSSTLSSSSSSSTSIKLASATKLCASLCQQSCEQLTAFTVQVWISHISDTIASIIIASIPSVLYEQSSNLLVSSIAAEREEAMKSVSSQLVAIQVALMDWCHRTLPVYLGGEASIILLPTIVRKLMLLDPLQSYYLGNKALNSDQLQALSQALNSIPIAEHTLIHLVLCNISSPLQTPAMLETDVLDICEALVLRAIRGQPNADTPLIELSHSAFHDALFQLTVFKPPVEQVTTETGEIVNLGSCWAHRSRVWKVCTILLLVASVRPSTIGRLIWSAIPTMRTLIEMVITRSWKFPPIDDEHKSREFALHKLQEKTILPHLQQAVTATRQDNGSVETSNSNSHLIVIDSMASTPAPATSQTSQLQSLAGSTSSMVISEPSASTGSTSISTSSSQQATRPPTDARHQTEEYPWMMFLPSGVSYAPPEDVIDSIKQFEKELKLSLQFFRCRDPDFINEMLKTQGIRAVGWLSPLVASDASVLGSLPSKCLGNLLLAAHAPSASPMLPCIPPPSIIPNILQLLEVELSRSMKSSCDVLQFFLQQLASDDVAIRSMANLALSRLFSSNKRNAVSQKGSSIDPSSETRAFAPKHGSINKNPFEWLENITHHQFYNATCDMIVDALLAAVKVETDIEMIETYLKHVEGVWRISSSSYTGISMDVDGVSARKPLDFGNSFAIVSLLSSQVLSSPFIEELLVGSRVILDIACRAYEDLLTSRGKDNTSSDSRDPVKWRWNSETPQRTLPVSIFEGLAMFISHQTVLLNSKEVESSDLGRLVRLLVSSTTPSDTAPDAQRQRVLIEYPVGTQLQSVAKLFTRLVDWNDFLGSVAGSRFATAELVPAATLEQIPLGELLIGLRQDERNQTLTLLGLPQTSIIPPTIKAASVANSDTPTLSRVVLQHSRDEATIRSFGLVKTSMDVDMPGSTTASMSDFSLELAILDVFNIPNIEVRNDGDKVANSLRDIRSKLIASLSTQDPTDSMSYLKSHPSSARPSAANTPQIVDSKLDNLSNLNQTYLRAASILQASPQCISFQKEFSAWEEALRSVTCSGDADFSFRLQQELSILQPFSASRQSTTRARTLEELVTSHLGKMHLFCASEALFKASKPDNIASASRKLLDHLVSKSLRNPSPMTSSIVEIEADPDLMYTMHWLTKIGQLEDFRSLIHFTFDTLQSSTSSPSQFFSPSSNTFLRSVKIILSDLLLSEVNWTTRRLCVTHFVDQDVPTQDLDTTICLDYLTKYMEETKGSGGDVASTQSQRRSSAKLFVASKSQLLKLVDLIMKELTMTEHGSLETDTKSLIARRAKLLLACCATVPENREEKLRWMIEYIAQTPKAHSMNTMRWIDDMTKASLASATPWTFRPEQLLHYRNNKQTSVSHDDDSLDFLPISIDSACERLLTQIYFECPWQVFSVVKHFTNRVSATSAHSKLDYVLHKLIKNLGSSSGESSLLILRTYALSHPAFIIKFLPTLSALLSGESQSKPDVFLSRNAHVLFDNVLGIVEMLIPLVFHDQMAKRYLKDLLDEYFKMLRMIVDTQDLKKPQQNPKPDQRFQSVVSNIAHFVGCYCGENLVFNEAVEYLEQYGDLLEVVTQWFPEIERLQSLLHTVRHKAPISPVELPLQTEQIHALRKLLSESVDLSSLIVSGNSESLDAIQTQLAQLESITNSSSHRANILKYLIGDILPFMSWSTANLSLLTADGSPSVSPFVSLAVKRIRNLALNLAAIHLHHFPREGEKVISAFVSCLGSNRSDIRNDALSHAKRIFLCCTSTFQQVDLLMTLFNIGKVGHNPLREIISILTEII